MCVVSAVTDAAGKQWPAMMPYPYPGIFPGDYVNPEPWINPSPNVMPVGGWPKATPFMPTVDDEAMKQFRDALKEHAAGKKKPEPAPEPGRLPTAEEIKAFLTLIEAAKKFDEIANQPHCEDPAKAVIIEAMEKRLTALEEAAARIEAKLDNAVVIKVEPTITLNVEQKS